VPLKQYFSSGAQQILLPLFGAVLAVVLLGALNAEPAAGAGAIAARRDRHARIARGQPGTNRSAVAARIGVVDGLPP